MTSYVSFPYSGDEDLFALLDFARGVTSAVFPRWPYRRPGDITWMIRPPFDPKPNIRAWSDGAGIAGYAWFEPTDYALFELHPAIPDPGALYTEMLAWAEGRARESAAPGAKSTLSTDVATTDQVRLAVLAERGYAPTQTTAVRYRRSLATPIPPPSWPGGAAVRQATEADIAERVACHRDAWSVWGPSSYSEAMHRWLRAAPEYDERFDLVTELPDGTFASCCLLWIDRPNRCGHFEPVGTRPALTGRGFAREMLYEGMRRLRQQGMEWVYVATAAHNARAQRAYPSAGFEQLEETVTWAKEL